MKILTLFARHGTEKYCGIDASIRGHLACTLPEARRDFVVIDTALGADYLPRKEEGVLVLGSSNDHWEFGAWNSALKFFGSRIFAYDYLHFVTSAFYFGYIDFHHFTSMKMLEAYRGRAVALGHIEVYNSPVTYSGVRFQSWLRSSYMFVPPAETWMLGDLVTLRDRSTVFSDDSRHPFLANTALSDNYQQNLISWLTGPGTGQGVQWHSRFDLDPSNFAYFANKAAAIINEMALSWRLRGQGCALVDMTWLRRVMENGAPPSVVPSWHQQLTDRGTGHETITEGCR